VIKIINAMLLILIKSSFKTLSKNKLTNFLTMLGIIIGITSIISIVSIGEGTKIEIKKITDSLGSEQLFISSGMSYNIDEYSDFSKIQSDGYMSNTDLTRDTVNFLKNKNLQGVKAITASSEVVGSEVGYNGKNNAISVSTAEPEDKFMSKINMLYGSFIDNQDMANKAKVIVIGPYVAKNIFGKESNAMGKYLRVGDSLFQVKGVIKPRVQERTNIINRTIPDLQSSVAYIPYSTAKTIFSTTESLQGIYVQLEPNQDPNVTTKEITTLLRQKHKLKQDRPDDFLISSSSQVTGELDNIISIITVGLAGIAGISLFVGGIGIMNTMIISVTERTREIGLKKALGAKNRDILLQFLFESITITFVGGVFGILLGLIISFVVQYFEVPSYLSWNSVFLSTGILVLIGIVFGMYPAYKASKLNPIDALKFE